MRNCIPLFFDRGTTGVDPAICFSDIQADASSTSWRQTDGGIHLTSVSLVIGNVTRYNYYLYSLITNTKIAFSPIIAYHIQFDANITIQVLKCLSSHYTVTIKQ